MRTRLRLTPDCPHADVRFCPLYHAAHEAGSLGCDDGKLGEGGCGVSRLMDYGKELACLTVARPQMVAELAFLEAEEERRQQRLRNMRLLGLH